MARERRLVREGKKLLVVAERVVTTKGDDYWTKAKYLAQHPKYEKSVIENHGRVFVIQVADSMSVNHSAIPAQHINRTVWSPAVGYYQEIYDIEYEIVASGTWYYLYPQVAERVRSIQGTVSDEELASRIAEIYDEVQNSAPKNEVTVEVDGKQVTYELNNWQLYKIGGPVRIRQKLDPYEYGKMNYWAEPSGAGAYAYVLVKSTITNVEKGNLKVGTVGYSRRTVSASINLTANGKDNLSYELKVSEGGIAANPFSVAFEGEDDSTTYYDQVDDDDFPPGVDWKP